MSIAPSKPLTIVSWVLQVIVAGIFVMAAIPKLTGDAGSVAMFEYLGFGPGRYLVGIAELAAAALLLIPKTVLVGAVLSAGVMIGAMGSHITKLGISIDPAKIAGDNLEALEALQAIEGPTMFAMAAGAFTLSVVVAVLRFGPLKRSSGPGST